MEAKRFLTEKKIDYIFKDVKNNEEAKSEFLSKNYAGVPVIIIDGKEILGFSRSELEDILDK